MESLLQARRGYPFASALMDPISKDFVAGSHRMCCGLDEPLIDFVKGQRKYDVALQYLAEFAGEEGVLFVGRAQEETKVFRTQKRRNPDTGATYPWIATDTAMVNHFHVYAVDADFGPFFLKFCSYFLCNARLCIKGDEYAERQAAKAGIGFAAKDNGFAICENPRRVQGICDRLSPQKIDALLRKWLRRLPCPFGRPDRAGLIFDSRVYTRGRTSPPAGSAPRFSLPGSARACTSTPGHTRRLRGGLSDILATPPFRHLSAATSTGSPLRSIRTHENGTVPHETWFSRASWRLHVF